MVQIMLLASSRWPVQCISLFIGQCITAIVRLAQDIAEQNCAFALISEAKERRKTSKTGLGKKACEALKNLYMQTPRTH